MVNGVVNVYSYQVTNIEVPRVIIINTDKQVVVDCFIGINGQLYGTNYTIHVPKVA